MSASSEKLLNWGELTVQAVVEMSRKFSYKGQRTFDGEESFRFVQVRWQRVGNKLAIIRFLICRWNLKGQLQTIGINRKKGFSKTQKQLPPPTKESFLWFIKEITKQIEITPDDFLI